MSSACAGSCRVLGCGLPFLRIFRTMPLRRSQPGLLALGIVGALLGSWPDELVSAADLLTPRFSKVSTNGDLQAQVRATAAKVLPAVVSIASTVMVPDQGSAMKVCRSACLRMCRLAASTGRDPG